MPYVHDFGEETKQQPDGARTEDSRFDGWHFRLTAGPYRIEVTFASDVEQSVVLLNDDSFTNFVGQDSSEIVSYKDGRGPLIRTATFDFTVSDDYSTKLYFLYGQHKNTPPDGGQPWYPTPRASAPPANDIVWAKFDDNGHGAEVKIRPLR